MLMTVIIGDVVDSTPPLRANHPLYIYTILFFLPRGGGLFFFF